jgi:hypothetical protein
MFPLIATAMNFVGPSIFMILFLLIALFASIFWILMIIDCAKYESGPEQVLWILVIIFAHGLGALIYYFVRKAPRASLRR